MPDQFGGVELEDDFGGVAVEEELTPPEREDFVSAPMPSNISVPEGVPTQVTAEQLEQLYASGQLRRPPDWQALTKRAALEEEGAGLRSEGEAVGTLERYATVAEKPVIPASITESAIALTTPALAAVPGVRRSVAEAASGLTSPVNIGLAVAGGGASAIPRLGGAVARGIAGGFAADIAGHMPALGTAAGKASVTGTPEEQQKALSDIGVSAFMGGLAGGGAFVRAHPVIPPRIAEAIVKADQVGLTKSAQAVADVVKREQPTTGVTDASKITEASELHADVRPSAVESQRQVPVEEGGRGIQPPAQAQGAEVLLSGPEVIRSIETLNDTAAGSLKQKPAVEAGMKLTEADVPALEAARDAAMQRSMAALESGNDAGFKAEYGKNIWFSGAIEGARRKGPNYDVFIEQQKAAATTPPEAVPAGPVGGGAVGRPAVGGPSSPVANARLAADRPIQEPYSDKFSVSLQVAATEFPAGSREAVIASLPENIRPQVDTVRFFTGEVVTTNPALSVPARVEIVFKDRPGAQQAVDYFKSTPKTETTPAQLPQTEISGAGAPPVEPPASPPSAPGAPTPPPPGTPRATLDDVYKIFEPAPKRGPTLGERASGALESFRTGFSSKFRPLNKLAEDVASIVGGTTKDVAGIFEQLKGSSGKAEADVYRFDKDVSDAVKGSEKDFNAYMFLRRSLDRLQQDAADIARAQAGENVPTLNRRKVSQYTIPQLESKLATLSEQIGGAKLAEFNRAAEAYQAHMDQALRLQVESGRMAPEVYDAIKAGNQFYAPFKVLKYIEESTRPEGSGRKVDTTADYVKAMEGIEDPNFKLGDMLASARYNINLSRTLAEKNRAMRNISELAALDTEGLFVQKLKPGQEPVKGMEAVTVLESGQPTRYQVNSDVAAAIHNMGGAGGPLVARMAGGLFRAGATTLNLPFQVSNLMADVPRQALVSKYGLKGATDLVRYPMDYIHALYSSIAGDVFGVKNQLFLDFLDSGAAGATVQQYLTPDALRYNPATLTAKSKSLGKTLLDTIPQFANAIEQTSKVVGIKRALRETGKKSGAELAREIPEAITEIRRFSGSPDFGRMGKWVDTYRLNLLYMFLNARIQGAVADVGRLTGRDGAPTAAKTWAKVGTAIGIPSAYLYLLNNSDEYREDYAQRPEQEKRNYWLIPKDTFITGSNGERMRDYWRVPKREIAQWVGNATESGMDFARQRDPEAFWKWAGGMAESLSPVNIQGDTAQERLESVGASLNPLVKAPLETATGRDMYRHRPIVPDAQRKASPELQYTDRTAEIFKTLADKMPDVAPEVFQSPLMLENLTKNFTAGLITQFLPRKPVEGRSATENQPLLQRFQALPYTDSSEFENRIQRFERESADEQLTRLRDAKAIMDANKGAQPEVLIEKMIAKHGEDVKLAERIVDLYVAEQRGITPQERRIIALPVTQRAEFLADELAGKSPEQKEALLRNWSLKRIMTERVAAELAPRIGP